jgi:hypothetical protein
MGSEAFWHPYAVAPRCGAADRTIRRKIQAVSTPTRIDRGHA